MTKYVGKISQNAKILGDTFLPLSVCTFC